MNKNEKYIHMEVPCDLKQIRNMRKSLREFCEDLNFNEEDVLNIELAFNEGASNAIDHGSSNDKNKNIDIEFLTKDKFLIIIIKDYGGKEFNPEYYERITLKKDWGRGGRGIYLMKSIMDEVSYLFAPRQYTILYLSKKMKDS